jgi:hypothetical protein
MWRGPKPQDGGGLLPWMRRFHAFTDGRERATVDAEDATAS